MSDGTPTVFYVSVSGGASSPARLPVLVKLPGPGWYYYDSESGRSYGPFATYHAAVQAGEAPKGEST